MKERFKIVWDNGKQYLWDFGNENDTEVEVYSINEADDLLNILSKENEQLKKQIERIDFILDDLNGQEYISRDDAINGLNKIDKAIK